MRHQYFGDVSNFSKYIYIYIIFRRWVTEYKLKPKGYSDKGHCYDWLHFLTEKVV